MKYLPHRILGCRYADGLRRLAVLLCFGRNGSTPPSVGQVSVDESAASTSALEQFDKYADVAIDISESAACPPILAAFAAFDSNQDSKISAEEIGARIASLYGGEDLSRRLTGQ